MTDIAQRTVFTDIDMQIVARAKTVFFLFSRNLDDGAKVPALTDNFALTPDAALQAATLLADMAYEADDGLKMPAATKLALIEKHRAKLLPRLEVMLNSQREKKTVGNDKLALQLLDAFCSEVFG